MSIVICNIGLEFQQFTLTQYAVCVRNLLTNSLLYVMWFECGSNIVLELPVCDLATFPFLIM